MGKCENVQIGNEMFAAPQRKLTKLMLTRAHRLSLAASRTHARTPSHATRTYVTLHFADVHFRQH